MTKDLSEMTLEELWQLFPIVLIEPDQRFESWYEEEKNRLLSIFSNLDIVINHMGSTAIKGIWDKPIIDILLEIPKESSMQEFRNVSFNSAIFV